MTTGILITADSDAANRRIKVEKEITNSSCILETDPKTNKGRLIITMDLKDVRCGDFDENSIDKKAILLESPDKKTLKLKSIGTIVFQGFLPDTGSLGNVDMVISVTDDQGKVGGPGVQ